MSEIYIAMDNEIEEYLWEKYPIVAHFCQELNNVTYMADFKVNHKGVFNKYDTVNITVYQEFVVFEISQDSYTFDIKTVVVNNNDVKIYEIINW